MAQSTSSTTQKVHMFSPRTSSPASKPATASCEHAIQSSVEFDDFDLSAWVTAYAPRFQLGQLLLHRGCAITHEDQQSSNTCVFVCPSANAACSGSTYTDGDRLNMDLKLICGSADCNKQSLAAKICGFLQSGHMTLSDLQDP